MGGALVSADPSDPTVRNCDVAAKCRPAGAIDDGAATNNDVVHASRVQRHHRSDHGALCRLKLAHSTEQLEGVDALPCPIVLALRDPYSITSSARSTIDCGTVRPSDLAVLRFMANSNFVGS